MAAVEGRLFSFELGETVHSFALGSNSQIGPLAINIDPLKNLSFHDIDPIQLE